MWFDDFKMVCKNVNIIVVDVEDIIYIKIFFCFFRDNGYKVGYFIVLEGFWCVLVCIFYKMVGLDLWV